MGTRVLGGRFVFGVHFIHRLWGCDICKQAREKNTGTALAFRSPFSLFREWREAGFRSRPICSIHSSVTWVRNLRGMRSHRPGHPLSPAWAYHRHQSRGSNKSLPSHLRPSHIEICWKGHSEGSNASVPLAVGAGPRFIRASRGALRRHLEAWNTRKQQDIEYDASLPA